MSGPDTSGAQAFADQFYNANIAPGIAQTQTNLYNHGMLNSSAGGAELGTMQAQGRAQETLQGQQYFSNALNNLINARSSLFAGPGNMAINAAQGQLSATQANQGVAEQQAQLGLQVPQLQNSYQLASTNAMNQYQQTAAQNANQFLEQNYGTQAGIYGNQIANNAKNYATQMAAK
jgi:hypothetical protein